MSTFASYTVDKIRQLNKAYADLINPDSDSIQSPSVLPIVITQSPVYNSKNDSVFYYPYDNYSNYGSVGHYKDLNKDKSVQKIFTKYYFYKIIDKWIYHELFPLLAFIDIDPNTKKPHLITSMEFLNIEQSTKTSKEDIEIKVNYMEKHLLSKDLVRHVLKKICKENNINWYELNKHENKIKKVFYKYLINKLKNTIYKI